MSILKFLRGRQLSTHFFLNKKRKRLAFLAHLSQRLIGDLIVYPVSLSLSSSSTIFKHLLLRNRLANQSKMLCGASLGRGIKVCINGPGHVTKMAATPIYGKNIYNSSPPEPVDRFPRNFVCSIGDSSQS